MNKFYKINQIRINIIITFIIAIWFVIFIKLFSLQIIDHNNANEKLIKNIASLVILKGDRGIIYDRNSIPLSHNINKYTLWVNPIALKKSNLNTKDIASKLSIFFNRDIEYYLTKMSKKSNYVPLEKNVQEKIIQNIPIIDGINIDKSISRFYPYSELASQLIGYTDNENIGKIGIESKFNQILNGGESAQYITKKGIYNKLLDNKKKPIKGADITLTIDIDLQTILQDELNMSLKKTGAKNANGVIIDPYSGNILAMASVPSIDLNNYSNYPIKFQKNRVITDIYEPGSTYKVFAMAGKLDMIDIYNTKEYYCENGKYIYFDKIFNDHEKHENLDLTGILAYSSNIGMVKIADEIGKNNIYKYTRQFGFGSSTGIALEGESFGIVRHISKWSGISAPEIAIGQEIAINNLQLCIAYCAIANGGFLLKPKIIDNIYFNQDEYYYEKTNVIRQAISNETSDQLLSMLREVVLNGTGNYANIKGFDIAGKTGTAQKIVDGKYSKENFISSFAAIFPSENPMYVCIISLDSANYKKGYHWAGISAAPIIKNIFERIIHIENNNTKTEPEKYFASKKVEIKNTIN